MRLTDEPLCHPAVRAIDREIILMLACIVPPFACAASDAPLADTTGVELSGTAAASSSSSGDPATSGQATPTTGSIAPTVHRRGVHQRRRNQQWRHQQRTRPDMRQWPHRPRGNM